ncbi:WRKY DNA-binding protein 54 [Artemisia annua]|uniref:WRKY DNA-binding protein 54 n=1 Tax=Artemisia annua TaxID=35608 RepID=A0A2U1L0G3_ARTAN|nr:WRKY DNA-binding protein 54 [Artemisia annua]
MEKNNKKLIETLVKGKSSAETLQNLIRKKRVNCNESGSFDGLLVDILGSFSGGLSMLGSCDSGEICGVQASPPVDPVPEVNSGKKPAPVVKERRGCYKRSCNAVFNNNLDVGCFGAAVQSTGASGCSVMSYRAFGSVV